MNICQAQVQATIGIYMNIYYGNIYHITHTYITHILYYMVWYMLYHIILCILYIILYMYNVLFDWNQHLTKTWFSYHISHMSTVIKILLLLTSFFEVGSTNRQFQKKIWYVIFHFWLLQTIQWVNKEIFSAKFFLI